MLKDFLSDRPIEINLDKFGLALNEYWELKKKLSENVSDIYLDTIYKKLMKKPTVKLIFQIILF